MQFVLIDCGARNAKVDRRLVEAYPEIHIIGFEPDVEECERLNETTEDNYSFFPVAIGKTGQTQDLYLTRNPACSSLYKPNEEFFGKFSEGSQAIEIMQQVPIQVVDLDTYLPSIGISSFDFMKLDVQGAELDILQGCRSYLESGVLGTTIEVEFSPIYQDQPLFADVDSFVREFDFMLFDLSRAYCRRKVLPPPYLTRGQLLWGHAWYLRDYHYFVERSMICEAVKLSELALALGYYDYAFEIALFLQNELGNELSDEDFEQMEDIRLSIISKSQTADLITKLLNAVQNSFLRSFYNFFVRGVNFLHRRITSVHNQDAAAWFD